jgi:hypothetical protein
MGDQVDEAGNTISFTQAYERQRRAATEIVMKVPEPHFKLGDMANPFELGRLPQPYPRAAAVLRD